MQQAVFPSLFLLPHCLYALSLHFFLSFDLSYCFFTFLFLPPSSRLLPSLLPVLRSLLLSFLTFLFLPCSSRPLLSLLPVLRSLLLSLS